MAEPTERLAGPCVWRYPVVGLGIIVALGLLASEVNFSTVGTALLWARCHQWLWRGFSATVDLSSDELLISNSKAECRRLDRSLVSASVAARSDRRGFAERRTVIVTPDGPNRQPIEVNAARWLSADGVTRLAERINEAAPGRAT